MASQNVIQRILRDKMNTIFEDNPHNAFTVDDLHKKLSEQGSCDSATILALLRQIISNGKVRVVYGNDKEPQRYKAVPPKLQESFIGLDDDHHRIYDLIDKAGNKGIWRRDIRKAGGCADKTLSNVLKELETRCLIKSITSIHEKKLKLYLLYDMPPSEEITGGVWYLDGTFNTTFVEQLIANSVNIVQVSGGITVKDMIEKIKLNTLAAAHITDKEAEQVITAMVHSKRVIKTSGAMLRPGILEVPPCPISEVPCCGCPVFTQCYPGGPINPRSCPYLQKLRELF
ncbi:RNA polymerase Rpc34 subunit family protein [Trichomonas vaginalis G3]|uniref:RNA polymerase Rpc34 subunit family protein n=1 Tax=Trichomonas vaginalis (strain ATCC PRA-98 / G3) TaxID=412133 RepID=A2E408_TRIV3|nr:transcription by RNA polymerase III [Trichomonas vaginalis G3]EAY12663.1 RNA polymerase Rpc34 subunit family protein [Trichomonas vaginalis G3]KAI5547025.1 transcription by RNA polymerase III [Trichomonas vaginalis G3]|eukprot:XP_001324886.1 RNA polymerase Rpc34 subunit family protein [Trichomonas vaginalis G3]